MYNNLVSVDSDELLAICKCVNVYNCKLAEFTSVHNVVLHVNNSNNKKGEKIINVKMNKNKMIDWLYYEW